MPIQKKILLTTSGGDCPGLNAVIRAIVRKSIIQKGWEVIGCMEAFNGLLREPMELKLLDLKAVSGIHVRGGTIIGTTNRGGPFSWPVKQPDGTWKCEDRSQEMLKRINDLKIDAVINI